MKTLLLTALLLSASALAGDPWVYGKPDSRGNSGKYPKSACIGAIVNGKCHGSILHPGPAPKTCHGTVMGGKCIGAEIG